MAVRWGLLLAIVGCAQPVETASLCEEAAATLEHCAGEVPDGFAEGCSANPDAVAGTVLSETNIETCPDPAKSDIGEQGFVDLCSIAINTAYWIIWARSPSSQPLPKAYRDRLRPWAGDIVDTARISWRSGLLTRWRVLGHDVVLEDDTLAQTFDNEIFIREAPRGDNRQLALIGHELVHARQYRQAGGVVGFARNYCSAFYKANFSYRQNALEVAAYDEQYRIKSCLDTGTSCPR
jgi:hypothetical protein